MLEPRTLYNGAPPEPRTRLLNHPTLLFSWWCTMSSLTIIVFRLCGRMIRTERLFREDKIMALSIIPLLIRMGLVHAILLFGTNNVNLAHMDPEQVPLRSVGARLVLASRIFYALFIWTAKFTVSEFLKRLTERFWKKSYERTLRGIRIFLVVSFFIVVIATLTECQPFDHYWQVTPDPGPQCRQGFANLITMGVMDVITDILLVVFPIPVVLQSAMPIRRKLSLTLLFSLSLILIGITCARVPAVIRRGGRQQYRSVFASAEILAAAAISNAIVLGSFLRDRGIKKNKKYKFGSVTDSMDRASIRRPTLTLQQWGSDEDLARGMGYRLDPELHPYRNGPRPAPMASPAPAGTPPFESKNWQFPKPRSEDSRDSEESDLKAPIADHSRPDSRDARITQTRRVSFFDVGGLLEGDVPSKCEIPSKPGSPISAHDFAAPRKSPRPLLSDLGGFWSQSHSRLHGLSNERKSSRTRESEVESYEMSPRRIKSDGAGAPIGVLGPLLARSETLKSLQDVGGLLGNESRDAIIQLPQSSRPDARISTIGSSRTPSRHDDTLLVSERPSNHGQDTGLSLQDVGGLLSDGGEREP